MRSLSIWAKHNPWKARIIIIISHLLLCALAFYIGTSLNDFNIELPQLLLFISLVTFLVTAAIYPGRKNSTVALRYTYLRRKIADCTIGSCTFLVVCCLANMYQREMVSTVFPLYGAANSIAPSSEKPTAEQILASLSHRDKSSLTRAEKRILKKEFKTQLKVYAKAKVSGNKRSAEKALWVMLAIILAVGLIYLLGALACTIACAGAEALGVILFVLGTIGIIIALIFVIIAITRGKKITPIERPAPKTNTGYIPGSANSNI